MNMIRPMPNNAHAARALWLEVLQIGLEDASVGHEPGWIGSPDFVTVCALAGLDAAAVRDRWAAGRVNIAPPKGSRHPHRKKKKRAA